MEQQEQERQGEPKGAGQEELEDPMEQEEDPLDVKRMSHVHHVPHIGLPQIEPVTSAKKVKLAPNKAAERQT